MKYRKNVVRYQLQKELLCALGEIGFILIFAGIVYKLTNENGLNVSSLDMILPLWSMTVFATQYDLAKYNLCSVFGFSRRLYFNEQTIYLLGQSLIYALARCVLRYGFFEDYMNVMLEEGRLLSGDQLQPVPLPVLFVSSILLFFNLRLLACIDRSRKHSLGRIISTNIQNESALKKKKRKKTWVLVLQWMIAIVVLVVVIMADAYFYEQQLLGGASVQWLILGGYALAAVILYFLARYRYQPKYL